MARKRRPQALYSYQYAYDPLTRTPSYAIYYGGEVVDRVATEKEAIERVGMEIGYVNCAEKYVRRNALQREVRIQTAILNGLKEELDTLERQL